MVSKMGTLPFPSPFPANPISQPSPLPQCPSSPILVPPSAIVPILSPPVPSTIPLVSTQAHSLPTTNPSSSLSHNLPSSPLLPLPLPLPQLAWNSLFKAKPINAGKYEPRDFQLNFHGDALVPPDEVVNAGNTMWKEYLVGFFLDTPLPYSTVLYYLKRAWKLRGSISVKSDGFLFLFKFSNADDRNRISEADPVVMRNKLFIVKPWDENVGNSCSSIKSVPVWIKLSNIPLFAWSSLGINWLAARIGKLLCMDASTEKFERITFAKCLVEVTPFHVLPESFTVQLLDGSEQEVLVEYLWKPEICTFCKEFGHLDRTCKKSVVDENVKKCEENEQYKSGEVKQYNDNKGKNTGKQVTVKQVWQKINRNKGKKLYVSKEMENKTFTSLVAEEINEVDGGEGNNSKLKDINESGDVDQVCNIQTQNKFNVLQDEETEQNISDINEVEDGDINPVNFCAEVNGENCQSKVFLNDSTVTSNTTPDLGSDMQHTQVEETDTRSNNSEKDNFVSGMHAQADTYAEQDVAWCTAIEANIKQLILTRHKHDSVAHPSEHSPYNFTIDLPGWPSNQTLLQPNPNPTIVPISKHHPSPLRQMETRSLFAQRRNKSTPQL
jgi:hypothetical protein